MGAIPPGAYCPVSGWGSQGRKGGLGGGRGVPATRQVPGKAVEGAQRINRLATRIRFGIG